MSDRWAEGMEVGRPQTPPRRVRLKADGRIVEILPDGRERTFADATGSPAAPADSGSSTTADDAAYARGIRARAKLTQAEFAAYFGSFNQQQISNYENGRVELPIELLLSTRKPNGRWPLQKRIPGTPLVEMEKPGRDSRWNTLRALRVLRTRNA